MATAIETDSTTTGLLAQYQQSAAVFNEFLSSEGAPRPQYAKLARTLESLGPQEIKRRHETSQRLVSEQGITYNVYGDPRGMERPWQLDPIPFIIAPDEWRTLEEGLVQRALLLNKILGDC
ncbi:MAG TPA: hypothetical protein VLT36_20625, partial [Candidatus Dormibacteraeota bacterium]|nr:hypothetical protein [Candidatus Dormibacteraeota bacterium]